MTNTRPGFTDGHCVLGCAASSLRLLDGSKDRLPVLHDIDVTEAVHQREVDLVFGAVREDGPEADQTAPRRGPLRDPVLLAMPTGHLAHMNPLHDDCEAPQAVIRPALLLHLRVVLDAVQRGRNGRGLAHRGDSSEPPFRTLGVVSRTRRTWAPTSSNAGTAASAAPR